MPSESIALSSLFYGPLVSVVMSAYNAAAYLEAAISSVLGQTYRHLEFIVVDDGSTDASRDILLAFASRDARVRPLFLPHGGLSRAINSGIAVAKGELIARMDADDVSVPERFEVQVEWMRQTGVDICGTGAREFGEVRGGRKHGIFLNAATHRGTCYEMLFGAGMLQPTTMMRADLGRRFPLDEKASCEEYEFYVRIAPRCRMGNVPRILLRYRRHPGQRSVLDGPAIDEDLSRYRRPHFFNLFPDAPEQDYTVVASVAEKKPFFTIAELARAGEILSLLAEEEDAVLRLRMARRWWGACLRSASMGPDVHRLYHEVQPALHVPPQGDPERLRLACGFGPGSPKPATA